MRCSEDGMLHHQCRTSRRSRRGARNDIVAKCSYQTLALKVACNEAVLIMTHHRAKAPSEFPYPRNWCWRYSSVCV